MIRLWIVDTILISGLVKLTFRASTARTISHAVLEYDILLARHIERDGCGLFAVVCENDLEGIVAKRRNGIYGEDWFKVRNRSYTQYAGRRELLEKRRRAVIV